MISAFDRIVIAVPDLEEAKASYRALFGADPYSIPADGEPARAWLGLKNVVLELRELPVERSAIIDIVLVDCSASPQEQAVENSRQLSLHICDGQDSTAFRHSHGQNQNLEVAVDHLVLHTSDAEACMQLFSVGLGIRLALDKLAPQWGGRMLFFRVGKLTLEVIELAKPEPGPDHFWGIAFRISNISSMAAQLAASGVELSSVRTGRKPGTKVATIKSHVLGLPTLLIEPATVE